MRDEDPPTRVLLIQERWEALQERKRQTRRLKQFPLQDRAPHDVLVALEPKPKPALAPSQGPRRLAKFRHRDCTDYVAAIRAIARPCTQKEIIQKAGLATVSSFSLWMKREGADCPVEMTRPRFGYIPALYFIKAGR